MSELNRGYTSVATRPKLCPCPRTCSPIFNSMVADTRIRDQEADMSQGYSGECVGRMSEAVEFIYGGSPHKNDLNRCVFTPLKGIIRFQECTGDIWSSIIVLTEVLSKLQPIECCECGESSRLSAHFHQLIPPEHFRPNMTPEEFNNAPRKIYCSECAVRLGLLKPWFKNFGKSGLAKYTQEAH